MGVQSAGKALHFPADDNVLHTVRYGVVLAEDFPAAFWTGVASDAADPLAMFFAHERGLQFVRINKVALVIAAVNVPTVDVLGLLTSVQFRRRSATS